MAPLDSTSARQLMPLKVLNCSLVFLRSRSCFKGSQIPAFSSFWIFLSRVQPVFARLEFSDHAGTQTFARARATLQ